MHELVIDVRKLFDSGIGTYIRNVVPRVASRLPEFRISLVGQQSLIKSQADSLAMENSVWMTTDAQPFSIQEQYELRRLIGTRSTFWATSLAHPLFTRRNLIATVHDVAQLALPDGMGGSVLVRNAARQYFRSLRNRASLLLFVSEFTRSELEQRVGLRSECSTLVTPLGVDKSWFIDPGKGKPPLLPKPYFVVVGNLKPHKNLGRVLQAFRDTMNEIPHELVIIGKHEGFRTADSRILESIESIGSRARFLGAVEDAELKATVASAETMIFASLYEGFGLPVLEAAAAGCIVITSQTGATAGIGAQTALFIDAGSVHSIANAMKEVASMSSAERKQRSQLARRRATEFTWDRTAELTANAIRLAINDGMRRNR